MAELGAAAEEAGWSATRRPTSRRPAPRARVPRASPGASTPTACGPRGPGPCPGRPAESSCFGGLIERSSRRAVVLPLAVPSGRRHGASHHLGRSEVVAGGPAHAGAERGRAPSRRCEAALDGRGAALVLAGPRSSQAERAAVEAWLRQRRRQARAAGGRGRRRRRATSCCSASRSWTTCSRGRSRRRGCAAARARLRHDATRRRGAPARRGARAQGHELHELNKIGVAALRRARHRQAAGPDPAEEPRDHRRRRGQPVPGRARHGGRRRRRRPAALQARPERLRAAAVRGAHDAARRELDRRLRGLPAQIVNVARRLPSARRARPSSISRSFDEKSGYRTKSMLVVPMRDHEDKVIGVVQLINKKRDREAVLRPVALVEEQVIPFTSVDEELVDVARQPGRGRLREHRACSSDITRPVRHLRRARP